MTAERPTTERLREALPFIAGEFVVHISHDWGNLFCRTCGAWPDTPEGGRKCPGPVWRTAAAPVDRDGRAIVREWWNDAARKTWRQAFEDDAERTALLDDLAERLAARAEAGQEPGAGLDMARFAEAWRRAERAVNVGGHRLTPYDVAREYAALATPTPPTEGAER